MPRHTDRSPIRPSRHKHDGRRDRSRSPVNQSIKVEPVDDDTLQAPSKWEGDHERRTHDGGRRYSSRRSSPSHWNSQRNRGQRLRKPVVMKEENSRSRRSRLHSPMILKEENSRELSNRSDSRGEAAHSNLSRSGLLDKPDSAPVQKQRANFGLSGKLTEDTNTYKGVVIKYNEPEDARKPTERWRLYAFKGNQVLPILHIHRQSGFLIGRDRKIADIPMDHPSISKQHAVLQYRFVKGRVRLYIIDLESVNGTYLNNERIEPRRYYELFEKDVIKFGFSTREYVVMTASLNDDDEDDDDK